MGWRGFSQKFYNVFGSKLQGWSDKIKHMDWSPEMKKVLNKLSEKLPEKMTKGLMKFVISMYRKDGSVSSESQFRNILDEIKKII